MIILILCFGILLLQIYVIIMIIITSPLRQETESSVCICTVQFNLMTPAQTRLCTILIAVGHLATVTQQNINLRAVENQCCPVIT